MAGPTGRMEVQLVVSRGGPTGITPGERREERGGRREEREERKEERGKRREER